MQAPVLAGEHGERRIVAHRAGRFLAVLHHGMEHQLQLLHGVAHHALAPAKLVAREKPRLGPSADEGAAVHHVADPLRVGPGVGQHVLDLEVVIEAALGKIDGDHLPGAEPAAFHDVLGRDRDHAGLRADHEHAVGGDAVAHRAQPVPVHAGQDPGAVGRGDRRRAVPGLHHAVAEVVERPVVGRHVLLLGPGIRDEQAVGRRHRAAGPHHAFKHRVERHRVRGVRLDQWEELVVVGAEDVAGSPRLVARHPILVTAHRVDLAVVGEHAEGLRQPPGREGVGGIALVEDRESRDEALVQQVRVERRALLGEEHPLVDERA